MPDRPACCVCPPGCGPTDQNPDNVEECVAAGCTVCLHECPRAPAACCQPAVIATAVPLTPYPPEITGLLNDLEAGRPVTTDTVAAFRAELDYLVTSLRTTTIDRNTLLRQTNELERHLTEGETGRDQLRARLAAVQAVRNDLASVARWCTTHGINPTAGGGVFLGTVRSQLTAAIDGTP